MDKNNQHLQNQFFPPQAPPPLGPRPNQNFPQPKEYHGDSDDLKTFKIKLTQFLRGNFNTYFDDVMYAGSLLQGPAQ